jgi:hypothetical protein
MKRIDGCHFEDARHLTQALVLGDLEVPYEAGLFVTGIPHLCTVGEDGDDEGIVDLPPVEEVEATNGVA